MIAVSKQYKAVRKNFLAIYEFELGTINSMKSKAEARARKFAEAEQKRKEKGYAVVFLFFIILT